MVAGIGDGETERQGDWEENTSRTSPTPPLPHSPVPSPYALCPILLYFATKVAKSGKSIGLEI